jgi:hypothetical protein
MDKATQRFYKKRINFHLMVVERKRKSGNRKGIGKKKEDKNIKMHGIKSLSGKIKEIHI